MRDRRLTVGVVTKNRPASLRECLVSLAVLGDALSEVIVVDDTSDAPIDVAVMNVPSAVSGKLHERRGERILRATPFGAPVERKRWRKKIASRRWMMGRRARVITACIENCGRSWLAIA